MVHLTDLSMEITEMENIVATISKYQEENVIEMNTSLDSAKKALNTLFVQVKEMRNQLKACENENLSLNCISEAKWKNSDVLARLLEMYESQALKKSEDYEFLKEEHINLQTEIKKHQSHYKTIEEQLQNEVLKYKETLQKYTETAQKNEELQRTNKELSNDIEKLKMSSCEEINKNYEEMNKNYKKVKEECQTHLAAIDKLQKELLEQKTYPNDNESLKKENNNLLMKIEKHQSHYKTIKKELQNKVLEYEETLQKYTVTFQVNKILEEEKRKLIEENTNMILENEKVKAECTQLEAKLIEKDILVHNTIAKIKEVENHTNNKTTELMNEKQLLSEKLEKVILENQVLSEKVTKAHHDFDLLKQNLKSCTEKTKKVCVQLEESNQLYQEEIASLTEEHDQLLHKNIHYEIDVAYYKSVILNNDGEILKLHKQIEQNSIEKADKSSITESCSLKKESVEVGISTNIIAYQTNASGKVATAEVGIVTDAFDYNPVLKNGGEKEINKTVVGKLENKRQRIKGVSDKICLKVKSIDDLKKLGKNPMLTEQNICDLLREVKRFYEATIGELHKKYKEESERQRTFYETSLSKLNYYNKVKLQCVKKEHNDKVKRLLDVHEEEIKKISLPQQWMHSISKKMNKPTKVKKQKE